MKTIVLALLRSRGAQEAMKRNFWLALWLATALGAALSVPIFIASQSGLGR